MPHAYTLPFMRTCILVCYIALDGSIPHKTIRTCKAWNYPLSNVYSSQDVHRLACLWTFTSWTLYNCFIFHFQTWCRKLETINNECILLAIFCGSRPNLIFISCSSSLSSKLLFDLLFHTITVPHIFLLHTPSVPKYRAYNFCWLSHSKVWPSL